MKVFIGNYRYPPSLFSLLSVLKYVGVSEKRIDDLWEYLDDSKFGELYTKLYMKLSERRVFIKIDKHDTWSCDHTLSLIVLPMLKQLKATKHGAPCVDDEDVPEELKSTTAPPKEKEYDTDGNHFKRWDWVLDEMIWAFEQVAAGGEDTAKFFTHPTERLPRLSTDDDGEAFNEYIHRIKIDQEGLKAHEDRKANGLRLFGRYYLSLWD